MQIAQFYFLCLLLLNIQVESMGYSDKLEVDTSSATQNTALTYINELRRIHQVLPLSLDGTQRTNSIGCVKLTESAANWSILIHHKASSDGNVKAWYEHSHREGEAVFVIPKGKPLQGNQPVIEVAVQQWYCEVLDFDFTRKMFTFQTAQFSQLMWKDSRQIGIAKVTNVRTGDVVITARFFPPGNWELLQLFRANVFTPLAYDQIDECPQPEEAKDKLNETEKEMATQSDQHHHHDKNNNSVTEFFEVEEGLETTFEPVITPMKHEKSPGNKWIPPTDPTYPSTTIKPTTMATITTTSTTTERPVTTTSRATTTTQPPETTTLITTTPITTYTIPTSTRKTTIMKLTQKPTRKKISKKEIIRYKNLKDAQVNDEPE